ncbi:MAG: hypothetical protein IPJ50_06610 [Betaproteobacteria bacterium]|nr:hypothetical protein [Betaproteobacteria bacterium]
MLSMQDVIDYCDLDSGEIEAIAEHEHIPTMLAAELSEGFALFTRRRLPPSHHDY